MKNAISLRRKSIYTIFSLAMMLFFLGCDDDQQAPPENQTCRLIGVRSTFADQLFSYNSKGLPETMDVTFRPSGIQGTSTFSYNELDQVIKITNVVGEYVSYTTYEYNDEGKIILETFTPYPGAETPLNFPWAYEFSYDEKGRVSRWTVADGSNQYDRYEYDENDNIIKIFSYRSGAPEYLYRHFTKYDDKKTPFGNVPFKVWIYSTLHPPALELRFNPFFLTPHNPLEYSTTIPGSVPESYSFTYRYNASGYQLQGSTTGTFEETDTFSYECF